MGELGKVAFYLGVIAYSAAATLFFMDLARREGSGIAQRFAPLVLGAGAGFHAVHVVSSSFLSHICPVESLHFALSLSALIAAVAYLALRRRFRIHAMGAFVAPAALTFLVGAQFVNVEQSPASPHLLLALHVTANLIGVGFFLLAGGAGVFYLVKEHNLREKRAIAVGGKLPALDALDRTEHRLLLAGFPLLTLGIVTGALFAHGLTGSGAAQTLRSVLTYTTWLVVGSVLFLRAVAGWRGRRAAYGTLAGVVCILIVFLLYAARAGAGTGL
ncbi:MAG TPA: cytochrome c biogenesis protein CcsA [Polyangiaceae bacterium]|jgi:ABC-type uncharacterized transport system permease subunit